MFAAQLLSGVGFSLIWPFLPLYITELYVGSRGSTDSGAIAFWAGLVFSSQALMMAIASPFWGALSDRFGYKVMVERSMYGGAVLLLLMGFVRTPEELTVLRVLQGLITGTISAANALVAAQVPRERLGYAMGTLQMGLWSGAAVGPVAGGVMSDTIGFRSTFITTAVLLMAAGVLVTVAIREPERKARAERSSGGGMLQNWWTMLMAPGMSLTYTLRFTSSLAQNMMLPFSSLFIASLLTAGQPVGSVTGLMVGISAATGTASAILLGRLGDRIGHQRILLVVAALAGLFYLPQALVQNAWQLLALQALSGAALGGIGPSLSALLSRYSTRGSEGTVYGLDASIVSGARALAPTVGAMVVAAAGLRSVFLASGAACLLIAVLAWRLPQRSTAEGSGA
jgi:DHA1 family multidrug resistance protein-like MFS transporter